MGSFASRYSVVASTAALVIALGGASYAAVVVTGADIQNGTVTTKDVKNRTLKTKDLSPSARKTLKGATGPAGAPGPTGPAGAVGPAGPMSPSRAVSVTNTNVTLMAADKVVLSVDLPAGSYSVMSKVWALRASGVGSSVMCILAVPGASDRSSISGFATSPSDASTLVNQLVFTSGVPATVTLTCSGSNYQLVEKTLTAVSVGAATSLAAPDVP